MARDRAAHEGIKNLKGCVVALFVGSVLHDFPFVLLPDSAAHPQNRRRLVHKSLP